ncbi:hypothetical protein LPJ57_003560 [Coemansia sp. RSA 486]|nr:hypothetical protein LPJ57_003560 [Coemansia sp. RSA 486]
MTLACLGDCAGIFDGEDTVSSGWGLWLLAMSEAAPCPAPSWKYEDTSSGGHDSWLDSSGRSSVGSE